LQAARTQVPVEQEALASANAQAAPHAPQLLRLSSGVSQPLAAKPSQSPNPELQVSLHLPDWQEPPVTLVPCVGQTVPQLPQLVASLWR
jgi:hypothetical protein